MEKFKELKEFICGVLGWVWWSQVLGEFVPKVLKVVQILETYMM